MVLLLYLLFPILCIYSIPPIYCRGGYSERVVYGIILYQIILFSTGVVLGLTHHLSVPVYMSVTLVSSTTMLICSWRNGAQFDIKYFVRWFNTRRGLAVILLAFLVIIAYALQICFDFSLGTRHIDGLLYHIPRMIFWKQQHSFDAWQTPVWQQIGLPVGADVILGQKIFLGTGWPGIAYVTSVISLGAIICVYIASLEFGFTRWQAIITALLFGSFPAIGLRIWSVNSDIIATFPVLASFVVIRRVKVTKYGISLFILLNAIGLACKPTVAPHAILLALVAIWINKDKIYKFRAITLPCIALCIAILFVFCSYWPVYKAFSNFMGGDGGQAHKVSSFDQFSYAVKMSFGHWLLEPFGYLTPIAVNWVKGIASSVYKMLGANFTELPESWKPWPAQDIGRSGLASILLLPILLFGFKQNKRIIAVILLLIGFILLSGMVPYAPYTARFYVIYLAGYALIWGGCSFINKGKYRWVFAAFVLLNVCALIGVVSIRSYVDTIIKSKPGGPYYYLSEQDRKYISSSLKGHPFQLLTNGSLSPLLVGPDIDFTLTYLTCTDSSDWNNEITNATTTSNWLAVVPDDSKSIATPDWHRPGFTACPNIPVKTLEYKLKLAGWQLYKQSPMVDLWHFSRDNISTNELPRRRL